MSEIENRIRQSLARQATSLPERTDLGGLTDRIARRNRRRMRGISVALVLALVAGPTLGYLAGQRGGEVQTDVATGAGGGVTVEQPPGPLPTVVLGGSDSNGTATAGGFSSEMLVAGGFSLPGVGGPLAKSFVREVDGTTIRLYRAAVDAPENAGPSWSDPPATCFPNGYAQADVSTEDAVAVLPSARSGP